ncbi:hypothetical protein Zmor_000937 [Zophobas morio]|uniref:Uncharacterized protein n=1 Tax=Zophobas morio TaxID=2755281 RepID=A0AA38I4M3_9CUCU|nr:hypothetical protein Zmor_020771 [Zophobas morio]KAJ3665441.1 hypothetical protein Zmor_000937 [Zophobas morio]
MNLFVKQFTTLFAISIFANFVIAIPQIFTDTYAFCEYEFGEKKVTFPDKLWTISTKDFTLHYSLCSSVQRICHNQTSTCLIQKNNNQVIDLGHEFTTDADEEFTLVSQGAKCSSNYRKNYILKISLQCSDSIKSKPRLMSSEDDCTFEVIMMKPDCEPKCTEIVAGAYLLDLRSLKKTFQVEVDSKKFSVTLCGSNRECPNEIGACEILQNGATPLASVESQHFNYDVTKDELTARGRYKQGRVVRDVQVLLKCNWDTDLANATYKKVPVQGKHYRFEVESSFGCIKLPQSCVVSSFGNLHYDLSKLYRSQGWTVSGFPRGKLFLNICGSLDQPEGVCSGNF